jgi:hypothetical protein
MNTIIGEHGHVQLKADAARTNFVTLEKQVGYELETKKRLKFE